MLLYRPIALSFLVSSAAVPALAVEPSLAASTVRPGDDALDQRVDPSVCYSAMVSGVLPVVPSPGLPPGLALGRSNNNLAIALHDGRLFLAFRTAATHFASSDARLVLLCSADLGRSWTYETSIATGRDLREPFLLEVNGRLLLYYAELGVHAYTFEPHALWRSSRCGARCWTTPERWAGPEEVAWDFKVRGGRAWMTSYVGKHYSVRTRTLQVRFRSSADGISWSDVGPGPVYSGGATEASFEFDRDGRLWAALRNEDGDESGFGSLVASADPGAYGSWAVPPRSNPSRFDSPRLFRHGNDVYMIARRNLAAPPGERFQLLSGAPRKLLIWASYSLEPKRTALFRLDPRARRFDHVLDLPSAGDTAFPSIVRLSPDEFLVANYSSAFEHPDRSWLWGQLNGTGIYFARLRFSASHPGSERAASPPLIGFAAGWPSPDRVPRGLAAFGAVSAGAVVFVRRRRRSQRRQPA